MATTIIDYKKVVEGIEHHLDGRPTCQGCVYSDVWPCLDAILKDALALIRELEAKGKAYDQVKWERDIAVGQLEQIGKSLGEKMDDVKNILARNEQISEGTEADDD